MPWISTNLAAAMGDLTAKANAAIADVQKSLANLNKQGDAMNSKLAAAISGVTAAKGMLNGLQESGVYMIHLKPEQGAWNARLTHAANNPPNLGYCFGTANIIMAPSLNEAMASFDKLKAAIMKPMQDSSNLVDLTDVGDFIPDLDPPEFDDIDVNDFIPKSWDDLFPADAWTDTSFGDVFGGAASGLATSLDKALKASKSLMSTLNQSNKMKFAVNKGLSSVQGIMAGMNATGVYNILLEPGAGNYITRLQTEANAPPTSPNMYTAGFAVITVAPDITALASKFSTLTKIIGV